MRVDKLIELREKIGNEPIMPDAEDKYEVMQMMKQPETMEEMQAAARLRTQEDPEYSARYKAPRQRPLRGGGGLAEQAENVRQAGRYGDTELMHVTPEEAEGLSSLRGGVTLNPETNLPEAFAPFIPVAAAAIPAIAGGTAAVAAPLAMGFGAKTVLGASALGGGLSGLAAGSLPSAAMLGNYAAAQSGALGGASLWGSLSKAAGTLWEGYQGMNPVFQGAIEGALTSPIMNTITGQETTTEDVMTGAVLGATLAGVRGKSFLGSMGEDTAGETVSKTIKDGVTDTSKEVADKGLFDTFLSKAKDTLTDPLALGLTGVSLAGAFSTPQQQALSEPRRVVPFEPGPPQFARSPIRIDPITGEDRFSEESLVSRVVEEGEGKGLGRQLTDAFTDPNEEINIAEAAGGGGLASLGRGEDNAEYGGEVAHISAEEAELLRRRGGAGTINPDTGLPEYYVQGGSTPAPGSVAHYARYGSWGGPPPGSAAYGAKYGTWGDRSQPNDPSKNPHLLSEDYYGFRGSGDGGGSPVEEEKVYNPFSSNLADFNVEDRLSRILGPEEDIDTGPIFVPSGSGTAAPISATPTNIPAGDAALEDLLSRFRAKRDDPIVASVAPVIEGSNRGGLVSLAHGGEPTAQHTPVFEGQVPMNGDGMDDEIPYKVIPQDPEDAPDTPDIALLSSDEYVLPADVVSMLGNGSSNAGAAALDRFSKLVRRKAHGTNKQQTELNEDKELANLIR